MPKEIVYDAAGMYDMIVGWEKDKSYVQLGVTTHSGDSIAAMLTDVEDGMTPADFHGLWGTLSEDDIDRLIKLLRKAKRQAYPPQKR